MKCELFSLLRAYNLPYMDVRGANFGSTAGDTRSEKAEWCLVVCAGCDVILRSCRLVFRTASKPGPLADEGRKSPQERRTCRFAPLTSPKIYAHLALCLQPPAKGDPLLDPSHVWRQTESQELNSRLVSSRRGGRGPFVRSRPALICRAERLRAKFLKKGKQVEEEKDELPSPRTPVKSTEREAGASRNETVH